MNDRADKLRRSRDLNKFRGKIGNALISHDGQLIAITPGSFLKSEKHDLTGATVTVFGAETAGTQVSGGRVGGGAAAGLILAGPLGAAIGAGAGALARKSRGIINVTLTLATGEDFHFTVKGKDMEQVNRLAGVVEYLNSTS